MVQLQDHDFGNDVYRYVCVRSRLAFRNVCVSPEAQTFVLYRVGTCRNDRADNGSDIAM